MGQGYARNCALDYLTSPDEDELLGAAYALATINTDTTGLDAVITAFAEEQDEERLAVFMQAFKHGQHPHLDDKLSALLNHSQPLIGAATVEILGYRRHADPRRIWPALHDGDPRVQRAAILALARFGYYGALPAAEQMLLQPGKPLDDDYLLVLLMLGSQQALNVCRRACQGAEHVTPKRLIYLALAGNAQDVNILLAAKQFHHVTPAVIQALGLSGHVAAVPHLLAALNVEPDALRAEAGEALEMITGAGLRERIQVPEEEPEEIKISDILGEDAASPADEKDEPPAPPRMLDVDRPCTSHTIWNDWWQHNAARFDPNTRWRKGQPFNLSACIDEIANPDSRCHDRERAYMELVIRSGQAIGFEPDWFIPRQRQAIEAWRVWWEGQRATLADHPWLFAGR